MSLHLHKIVQNEHYGYPDEWFPSVSATIGDRYPERSIFQVLIAVTSGPRFALVALWYLLTAQNGTFAPKFVAFVGLTRTFLCGGWVYVTSTDDHGWHEIFMILYLVFTLPWTLGCIALSPMNKKAIKHRKILAGLFFGTLVPLIHYFIQHKVHRVPGAYTKYAFFEWSLILFDIGFDFATAYDFAGLDLRIVDVGTVSKGSNVAITDSFEKSKKDSQHNFNKLLGQPYPWSRSLDVVADIYSGFVFWSILTSLGVTIWYFPLWHMGISGYEVLIMTTISPFLLGASSIRRRVISHPHYIYALSLTGIVAFAITQQEIRLFLVSAGVFFSCLAWAGSFWAERNNPGRLDSKISAFSLGLLASNVAKFANYSNNPIWPIMNSENGGWNKTGLFLAIFTVWRIAGQVTVSPPGVQQNKSNGPSIFAALGLGGLLFGLHSLLSDSSTMITWIWEGYPIKGPIPVPHGAFTIAAMGFGFLIGFFAPGKSTTWPFYATASIASAVFYGKSGWFGYCGGLVLAVYLMALIPPFIASATRHDPGKTFGLAFLFYNVIVLAHVWVVAYAFVPGGPLLRERTDIVMGVTMILLGCGVFASNSSTPLLIPQSTKYTKYNASHHQHSRSYVICALTVLQLISIAVAFLRFPTFDYMPYHPTEKIVTAGIWTVHFALDNDMWSSERRIRDVIRDLELDVVGLLETDLQRIIMGNRDLTQFIAEDLGMYADFGPGPNKHTWGAALLSKFPIVNSTHHLLPSPVGELAPALHATLDMYGELVDVIVFHSGQEEDVEDRRLQSAALRDLMAASPRPLILLSYLVTEPGKGNYNTYVSPESRMKDIDPDDWDRWCEYILYRGLKRVGYARVSRGFITDTEIQVGKFVVGEEGGNERVEESVVQAAYRFPDMFKGDGVRGHYYHVFNESRYYN